jgi:hypothetical protein
MGFDAAAFVAGARRLVGPAAAIWMNFLQGNSVPLPGVDPPGANKNTNK